MMIKKPRLTLQLILGAMLLTSMVAISCNNSGDKKDAPNDSVKTQTTVVPPDTTKMDTAKPRPVQTPNKNP
jgi:hypothetical protein